MRKIEPYLLKIHLKSLKEYKKIIIDYYLNSDELYLNRKKVLNKYFYAYLRVNLFLKLRRVSQNFYTLESLVSFAKRDNY